MLEQWRSQALFAIVRAGSAADHSPLCTPNQRISAQRRAAAPAAAAAKEPAKRGKKAATAAAAAAAEPPAAAQRGKKTATPAAAATTAAATTAEGKRRYYLVKSEPSAFSIADLAAKPGATGEWDGVRNAQARNIMQGMKLGDQALFYHSSCKSPGVVGVVECAREAYPDFTAFDAKHDGYDARSTPEAPKWHMVDWRLLRRTRRHISLAELREHSKGGGALEGMALFSAVRLSVQPVTEDEWAFVMKLEQEGESDDEDGTTGVAAGKKSGGGKSSGDAKGGGGESGGGGKGGNKGKKS